MSISNDPTKPEGRDLWFVLASGATNFFVDGWLLMLLFGVLHASSHAVPAFGYWQSAFAAWVFAGIASSGVLHLNQRIKQLGRLVTR